MKQNILIPTSEQQQLLERVKVRILESKEQIQCQKLLEEHHYLGGIRAVGERMGYVAEDTDGKWLALSVFCAAAKHLKHRDRWIGWSAQQRWKRLSLVTNQARFLILPWVEVPNFFANITFDSGSIIRGLAGAIQASGFGGRKLRGSATFSWDLLSSQWLD